MNRENLIKDFADLVIKYEELNVGTLVDTIVGSITAIACYAADKTGKLDSIQEHLCDIVKDNCETAIPILKNKGMKE